MKKKLKKTIILTSLFLFMFLIPANAASYKKAYRAVVKKFEKKYKGKDYDKCMYNLIYINKDKKPELICEAIKLMPNSNNIWYSYSEYYTFYSGKTRRFCEDWSNPFSAFFSLPFYQPKKNVFGFRCWNQGSISDCFWKIKKGKRVKKAKTKEYGRTGDVYSPKIASKYKWIKAKYSKKKILKKLK